MPSHDSESKRSSGPRPGTDEWLESLEFIIETVLKDKDPGQASRLLAGVADRLRAAGISVPRVVTTPYVNTISPEDEPEYPGNREIERSIKSFVRWNAMAMVVKANRLHGGLGGHISTYASAATLYEVGFNHFFRGAQGDRITSYNVCYTKLLRCTFSLRILRRFGLFIKG